MPYALSVDVVEPDGDVAVRHTFYGESEAECRKAFAAHAAGCEMLGPAIENGDIEEEMLHISEDERPSYDVSEEGADAEPEEEDEDAEPEEEAEES